MLSLSDPDDPATTQPYHAGFGTIEVDEARIAPRLAAVARAAQASVERARDVWHSHGPVAEAVLVVGSLNDPHTVRHQHMRAHAFEGRLFRTVLANALQSHGIPSTLLTDRDLYARVAGLLDITVPVLGRMLDVLRSSAGKSWSTDHRLAAAAALSLLARSPIRPATL